MTELTFARTRIQPPRVRADLIARPALQHGLQQALAEQRLTLIVAPAGWGKTSLLAQQIAALPQSTALAWIAADADDDVPRFLAGLTAALAPLDLPWRVAPIALMTLLDSARGTRAVADEIVNALTDSELARGLLVIDDTHRWKDAVLFELLTAVIEHLPNHWGVVISTRVEPALPVARWRARGELSEFRQAALRFDANDVRNLLASKGLDQSSAQPLQSRTQGWAVGLRLMLSLGKLPEHGAGTSQRDVFDYLASEVLEHMQPDMQAFLLRCSVLPELSLERCAHVSASANARELFAQIEREGIFVTPLDESGQVLRLHDLFREFLQARLQVKHAPEMPELLVRAAAQEPNLLRAVTWLVQAGAIDLAEVELAKRGQALLQAGGQSDLLRMMAMLPAAIIDANPDLSFLRGICAIWAFDFELNTSAMVAAERAYASANRPEMALFASVWKYCGRLSSGGASEARVGLERIKNEQRPSGALGAMVSYLLVYVAETESRVDGIASEIADMVNQLASEPNSSVWEDVNFLSLQALYPGAPAIFERHIRNATARHNHSTISTRLSANHLRATIAFGRAQLIEALEHLANADSDMEWLGRPRAMQEESNALHAYVHGLLGRAVEARQAAERALATLQ